jgi:hypothetical protein
MNTTIEEEYTLLERLDSNKRISEATAIYQQILVGEAKHEAKRVHPLQCVVCGEPMKAQRRSKKTCSSCCRLRLSRWLCAYRALPEAEKERRYAEIQKRHEQAVRTAAKEERREPKGSRDKITEDIKRDLEKLNSA